MNLLTRFIVSNVLAGAGVYLVTKGIDKAVDYLSRPDVQKEIKETVEEVHEMSEAIYDTAEDTLERVKQKAKEQMEKAEQEFELAKKEFEKTCNWVDNKIKTGVKELKDELIDNDEYDVLSMENDDSDIVEKKSADVTSHIPRENNEE